MLENIFSAFISPGPNIFQLGPFSIRWYGVLIAISVLIGLNISNKLANKIGLEKSLINDLLPILVFSSIIGARIYYVAFEWREYKFNWFEILAIWQGGIAIHGALIAGFFAVFCFCRLRSQPFLRVLDVLFPSVALGQSIGRWGNFFNNEAFGLPTDLPWKLDIPFTFRPIELTQYQYFHPTFLYESIWNLGVFFLLIYIFKAGSRESIKLPQGAITLVYFISYSCGRVWIEGLRIDSLCIGGLPPFCSGGIRVAQLISIFLIVIGVLGLWYLYIKNKELLFSNNTNQK